MSEGIRISKQKNRAKRIKSKKRERGKISERIRISKENNKESK